MADCSYSNDLVLALLRARVIAPAWGADELRPEHLLLGLFPDDDWLGDDGYSLQVLLSLPSSFPERLKAGLLNSFPPAAPKPIVHGDLPLDTRATALIEQTSAFAKERGDPEAGPLHLMKALIEQNEFCRALEAAGLTKAAVERALLLRRVQRGD